MVKGDFNNAALVRSKSGILTAGFVATTHSKPTVPMSRPSIIAQASFPGSGEMVPGGNCQAFSKVARCSGFLTRRYPGSKWASPPASLPPMALG